MKRIIKSSIALIMALALVFSLAGCSQTVEVTEDNIREAVVITEAALRSFDTEKLKEYVDSPTLNSIISYAEKQEQFQKLGELMFSSVSLKILDFDTEKQTVTVIVSNKNMEGIASRFMNGLLTKYSTSQLLNGLKNESFLNASLEELQQGYETVTYNKVTSITLEVVPGKEHLILSLDDAAEDAMSGGVITAIKTALK